uniref:Malectin-like domain-containing protein n=1 Tax=Setaria italica TaxID=4555 RepID=K4A0A1_SETIT
MAFLLLFAAFVLAQADHVVGQPPGFLSIDCGLDPDYSGYTDKFTGVVYVSDGPYVDAGENRVVAVEPKAGAWRTRHRTLRSFPSGVRNCYALPTVAGTKYLLRGEFFYGNYDGRNSSTVEFNLHLGPNSWDTVTANADDDIGVTYEALFVAWASWAPACLVNTGRGTPFVSVLELRPLAASLYPPVAPGRSMSMYNRRNVGANGPQWANLSTTRTIQPDPSFVEPLPVLQTAVTLANNSTTFNYTWPEYRAADSLMLFLHFADFQSTQLREFDIYFNGNRLRQSGKLFSPPYLSGSCVYSPVWYKPVDNKYNITLVGAETSVLPPMLNAFEIYKQISNDNPTTLPEDFDAIMAIKLEYGVKKNWMGDPCSPTKYAWEGVTCINTSDNTTRITSLDLSNSHLRGVISDKFALLTALQNLNVSGNHLSGDFLCKNHAGSLVFRYYQTGRLTESSDVYSFGVVLLEVATGEPPIVPGHGHIVQRVKQLIATGDVSLIADGRLGGAYDVSSMWKVVDIAMMCVVDAAAQRPTMATVVAQLKESLALEEAREREYSSNNRASPGSDIASLVSTFGPVAR